MSKKKNNKLVLDCTRPLDEQLDQMRKQVKKRNKSNELLELPDGSIGKVRNINGVWVYHALNEEALNAVFMQWFAPFGMKSGMMISLAALPSNLVKAYIGAREWDGIPLVKQLANAPVIRPNGTIRWAGGYDEDSQVYVTGTIDEPEEVKGEITEEMAKRCAGSLLEWLETWPFVYEASKADCIGLALTPMVMPSIPNATIPGGVFTANRPGSGKTTCARFIGLIGSGSPIEVASWPKSSEISNSITTALNDGDRQVVLYDNVKTDLSDDSIEALLTSRWWTARRFHSQKNLRLPNNSLWLFTKNSASASEDMLRRLMVIPLDPDQSPAVWNPYVLTEAQNAVAFLRTLMTVLIKYWIQQGRKKGSVSYSGFEEWSETISGILEASGIEGFMVNRDEIKGSVYTDSEDIADMINRIGRLMAGRGKWSARDLYDTSHSYDSVGTMLDNDCAAVRNWIDSGGAKNGPMATGHKLSELANKRMVGTECVIKKVSSSGQAGRYEVESLMPVDPNKVPVNF